MYHIMIVDDEPISADAMAMFLQEEGDEDWEITTCYSAKEALQNLNHHIDVLVTDIMMPETNGFQLAERIRKRWNLTKIIFITASNEPEYIRNALRQGNAEDYFLKTDNTEQLLLAIRRALQKTVAQQREMDEQAIMRQQIEEALPLLRDKFIQKILQEALGSSASVAETFARLHIPLSVDKRVLLLYGKCLVKDVEKKDLKTGYFRLENLITRYTGDVFAHIASPVGTDGGVWLFQIADEIQMDEMEGSEYLFSALDLVQQTYSRLGGSFPFILDDSFCDWKEINSRYFAVMQKGTMDEDAAIRLRYSGNEGIEEMSVENGDRKASLFLEQVKRQVEYNLDGDLSLISIAEFMGMSPSYFSRVFKKVSGSGYMEYVTAQRVREGARLLRETKENISDITLKVGYFSASHFIRVFTKYYGMTPNEYRKMKPLGGQPD